MRLLAYGLGCFDRSTSNRTEVLKRLREVNDRLHQRRYKRSNKKFRKWEWAARTAEFQDKVILGSNSQEDLKGTVGSNQKGNALHTGPEVVCEAVVVYFVQAFSHEEVDMSFLSSLPVARTDTK